MRPPLRARAALVASVFAATLAGPACGNALAQEQSLLDEAARPAGHLQLRLHVGEYQIRSSEDGHIHVLESPKEGSEAPGKTDVRFRQTANGARLEVDPPMGKSSPHVTIAVPPCAVLDVEMNVGQLVLDAVPCAATTVSLHIGELRAALGDANSYRTVKASVSIGEVDAHGLGQGHSDEQHGGFFRGFAHSGGGSRRFAASVGSGHIALESRSE